MKNFIYNMMWNPIDKILKKIQRFLITERFLIEEWSEDPTPEEKAYWNWLCYDDPENEKGFYNLYDPRNRVCFKIKRIHLKYLKVLRTLKLRKFKKEKNSEYSQQN